MSILIWRTRHSPLLIAGTLICLFATLHPVLRAAESGTSNGEPAGPGSIPAGFTRIFNGRDLTGWHMSRTEHHGTVGNVKVENGEIVMRQFPYGQGGLLVTDKRYKDFDLYLEVNLDASNGGLFFRSTEGGSAYQVELWRAAGNNVGLISENNPISAQTDLAPRVDSRTVWKEGDWNSVRLRSVGLIPRITLWLNGVQLWDVQMAQNDYLGNETDGVIGLQLHFGSTLSAKSAIGAAANMWRPDGVHRYRNIAIKELP